MASASKLQVAVLDDYQGFADPVFKALDSSEYEITSLKETLLPYNHPDTPESVRDELVKRLQPFDIICEGVPRAHPTTRAFGPMA